MTSRVRGAMLTPPRARRRPEEDGQRRHRDQDHDGGGHEDRQIASGDVVHRAGQEWSERRAEAVADREEPEHRAVAPGRRNPEREDRHDRRPAPHRQEDEHEIEPRDRRNTRRLERDQRQRAAEREQPRHDSRRGRTEAIGHEPRERAPERGENPADQQHRRGHARRESARREIELVVQRHQIAGERRDREHDGEGPERDAAHDVADAASVDRRRHGPVAEPRRIVLQDERHECDESDRPREERPAPAHGRDRPVRRRRERVSDHRSGKRDAGREAASFSIRFRDHRRLRDESGQPCTDSAADTEREGEQRQRRGERSAGGAERGSQQPSADDEPRIAAVDQAPGDRDKDGAADPEDAHRAAGRGPGSAEFREKWGQKHRKRVGEASDQQHGGEREPEPRARERFGAGHDAERNTVQCLG